MRSVLLSAALVMLAVPAQAASPNFHVIVSAKANVFGAGVGGAAGNGGGLDPIRISIPAGATYVVITQARGRVSCCGGGATFNSANGGTYFRTNIQSSGGISGIIAPVNMFLIGVFVGPTPPQTAPPPRLDVSTAIKQADVFPQINQTFFVGSGGYASTAPLARGARRMHIPRGARAFVLGFADSNGFNGPPGAYDDNVGSLDVRGSFGFGVGAANSNTSSSGGTSSAGNLQGTWFCTCGPGNASVVQNGTTLQFTNEKGMVSRGRILSASTVIADDWQGGLRGAVNGTATVISWANGTTWMRGSPSGAPGAATTTTACYVNAGAYAAIAKPCFGPVGSTMTAIMERNPPVPLTALAFTANLVYSTAGLVTAPLSAFSNGIATATVPAALCTGTSPHKWNVWLVDANGKSQGVIGDYTATGCP